jgi:acetyl-CoA acetyltransferase family protein
VLAHEFGITRQEQDEFALQSHRRAVQAKEKLDEEIVPVYAGSDFTPVTSDNGPRAQQTMEALGKLKPLFDRRDGTVTAGNSCQVSDGAAAMIVADAGIANGQALGWIRGYAFSGLDPVRMGLGPVFAIDKLLKQNRLSLKEIDLLEINEAFAAQVLACVKAIGSANFAREHLDRRYAMGEVDPQRLNVNGGAIALGHPVGATGARLVLTLLMEMQRRDVQFGIAALCVGGGQGAAILLERK